MMHRRQKGDVEMETSRILSKSVLALLAVALVAAQPAAAAEVTWSYSGQVTYTAVPGDFPLGSPVHLALTVDPDLQTLVSATVTLNGAVYQVAGPRSIGYLGTFSGVSTYYSSGPATGATVGDFVPWFGTFFLSADYPAPFTYEPFYAAQSFIFEDQFARAVGAAGLTLDSPPTPRELLSSLNDAVAAMNLPAGIGTSLCASLNAALAKLDDGNLRNDVAAVNDLRAFIHEVEAQRGKRLTEAQATYLRDSANAILLALGG
jgi:hypothetical protein